MNNNINEISNEYKISPLYERLLLNNNFLKYEGIIKDIKNKYSELKNKRALDDSFDDIIDIIDLIHKDEKKRKRKKIRIRIKVNLFIQKINWLNKIYLFI